MKDKNFLKHFAIIGSGTFLHLVFGVLTTPLITRIVAPVEYGQYSIFTMYSSMALIIFLLGMDQAMIRYYYEREDIAYKRALLFRCIQIPVIVTGIVAIIIIVLSVTGIVNFEFDAEIMILLCFHTFIQVIYRFSTNLNRLEYNSKMYSTLNVLLKLIYVLLAVPMLLIFKSNYLLILVCATVIANVICLIISILSQKSVWNIRENSDEECMISRQELLRYALPLIVSMGITTLFQAIDKISLNYYCTYTEVGIYSSTMTLVNIFAIVQTTFNTLWHPMAIEHYSKDKEDRTFYQKGNQIITVIMFFIGLSLILGKDIFAILLGEKYREAAYILPFLIFQPIMYTVSETTVTGIAFMKKSKMQIIIAATACITNIIGNTILVPQYGCQGAAISTGISYIVFFTMRTVISNKYFYVDFKLKRFYILTAASCVYAFYNTFVQFNLMSIIGYAVCLLILFLLYKDTVVWGINYMIRFCKDFIAKEKGGEEL